MNTLVEITKSIAQNIQTSNKKLTCNNKTYFLKPITQLAYLTKSIVINGLPTGVNSVILNEDSYDENAKKQFHSLFTQLRACNTLGMWAPPSSLHLPLISNAINKSIQYNGSLPPGRGFNLISNFQTCLTINSHLNRLLRIDGKVSKLYLSEIPLSSVMSSEEIADTTNVPIIWNEIFRPTFHLEEHDIPRNFLYPIPLSYPNLLVSFNLRIKQAVNRAIINAIAVAGTMAAISNNISLDDLCNGNVGEYLANPYVLKAIGFDGRSISFLIIQINTLNWGNPNGIKNVIWFDPPQTITSFKPCYMLHRPNKMSHIKRRFVKQQTYNNIVEDFQFEPIVNLMRFLHF